MTAPDDLDALVALAQAATPGPWETERRILACESVMDASGMVVADINRDSDAAFIAACSPDVILSLVEELRTVKSHRAGCTSLLGQAEARAVAAESRCLELETRIRELESDG